MTVHQLGECGRLSDLCGPNAASAPVEVSVLVLKKRPGGGLFGGVDYGSGQASHGRSREGGLKTMKSFDYITSITGNECLSCISIG